MYNSHKLFRGIKVLQFLCFEEDCSISINREVAHEKNLMFIRRYISGTNKIPELSIPGSM